MLSFVSTKHALICTNLLIFVFFSYFMLKDFLKINDHTLTSKVGGIFHDLFTRVGTLANKNNFYTICEKYETFRFKLGLERCACNVFKVFPKKLLDSSRS